MQEYNFNPMYIIRLIHRYFMFICRSLVKAIGIENLQHVLDIMSMINDEQEIKVTITIFEPRHEISNNVVCATSKASVQPAHGRSLIRAFASSLNVL